MEQPKRTYSRVNHGWIDHNGFLSRFDRLRIILVDWEQQIENMPYTALDLFEQEDLHGIQELMKEQKIMIAQVRRLKEFIAKWETPGSGFVEVARFRDE